ncbi:hypothetical protein Tco_0583682 [Tanacetum coccineum]
MLAGRQPGMYFQIFLSSQSSQTVYTAYPNPMDMVYLLSGHYPVFILSTVYTMYSLNGYSVLDTGINTAYPGEWMWRIYLLYSFRTSLKEKKSTMLVENLQSGNLEVLES